MFCNGEIKKIEVYEQWLEVNVFGETGLAVENYVFGKDCIERLEIK